MRSQCQRQKSYRFGLSGETTASAFLASNGFEILKHRYRNACGEIDLIAKRSGHLAFVEVKSRRTCDEAAWSVAPRQQKKIRATAEVFLAENPDYDSYSASFDVILVSYDADLVHIPQAFGLD
jgi:putative endonuclease